MSALSLSEDLSSETRVRRARQLKYLVYLQVVFLAFTYAVGIWLATEVHNASITLPQVIVHGIASSGFALLTAVVGFLAALQGQKLVSVSNLTVFFFTLLSGAQGFAFLGNTSDSVQIMTTNLSMMGTIGLGMPITGYSLAKVSRIVRHTEQDEDRSLAATMTYLALGALSLTIIAGTAVETISLYAFAVVLHVGLAAFTVSLVLGIVVLSVLEGSYARSSLASSHWVPQRVAYSLLGLAAISLAAGDGVITTTLGGVSYVVVMAEVTILVYAFLILTIGAPFHLNLQSWTHGFSKRIPRKKE